MTRLENNDRSDRPDNRETAGENLRNSVYQSQDGAQLLRRLSAVVRDCNSDHLLPDCQISQESAQPAAVRQPEPSAEVTPARRVVAAEARAEEPPPGMRQPQPNPVLEGQNADRINRALAELQNGGSRSRSQVLRDLRETLSTQTEDQIGRIGAVYQERYGRRLAEDILQNDRIPPASREALGFYLRGSDTWTNADTTNLFNSALRNRDLEVFAEVARAASPEARRSFLDNDGQFRVDIAFGPGLFSGRSDYRHAQDYLQYGRLSTLTQVRENAGLVRATTNDSGIDLALDRMTPDERRLYTEGRRQVMEGRSADASPEAAYYSQLREALSGAGNATRLEAWENRILNNRGSLANEIANQRGMLWNGSREQLTGLIENMSQTDWQYFNDPQHRRERRQEMQQMLGTLRGAEDVREIMTVFDRRVNAESFERANQVGRRDVLQALNDATGVATNDRVAAIDAITNMRPEEQERYRSDSAFRQQVDAQVRSVLGWSAAGTDASQRALQAIAAGNTPPNDLITRLQRNAANGVLSNDRQAAFREIEQELRSNPQLREQLRNPQTDEQRRYAAQFSRAAEQALGSRFAGAHLQEFLREGSLSLERINQMYGYQGRNADYTHAFSGLAAMTPAERTRLAEDNTYRRNALRYMSPDNQAIAAQVARTGEFSAADRARAAVVGGNREALSAVIQGLQPAEIESFRNSYRNSYGREIERDLESQLSPAALSDARRAMARNLSPEERFNQARDEQYRMRSGVLTWVTENIGRSAAGSQADDVLGQQAREVARINANPTAQDENFQQLERQQQAALANVREARNTAVDLAADTAAVAVGTAVVGLTGGLAAPAVIGAGLAGGAARVGTRAALQGSEYDSRMSAVATDFGAGAITAATALVGPGQIASVLRMGRTVANEVRTLSTSELMRYEATLLSENLVPGGEAILERGLARITAEAIARGATRLESDNIRGEVTSLARQALRPMDGRAFEANVDLLADNLHNNLRRQYALFAENRLRTEATAQALNFAAGALGNGAAETLVAATEWNSNQSTGENLEIIGRRAAQGAALGGATALGLSAAMRYLRRTYVPTEGSPYPEAHIEMWEQTPVSPEFRSRVQRTLDRLPLRLQEFVANRGSRAELADSIVDMRPDLEGVRPRGWSEGSTWADAGGMQSRRSIYMAERRAANGPGGEARVEGVVRHEIGHVVDEVSNWISTRAEFAGAYRQDLQNLEQRLSQMSRVRRERILRDLAYFRQPGADGQIETFAELLGILTGGGCATEIRRLMMQSFPNSMQQVQQHLDSILRGEHAYPANGRTYYQH